LTDVDEATARFPAVVAALREPGHAYLPGERVRGSMEVSDEEWSAFAAHWDDLVLDPYVGQEPADKFRYRRYGRLALALDTVTRQVRLRPLPNQDFRQDADHVARYEGRARRLEFVTSAFLTDPVLHALVALDFELLPQQPETYEVGLHAIRVRVDTSLDSRPTPEGRHRDGHDFIAMHLIEKRGCAGGETLVYEQGSDRRDVIDRLTLDAPLDTLVVDDTAVDHEVTRLEPLDGGGHRDVLLVAFYPMNQAGEGQ
jgi:hypothetical protein